MIKFYYEQQSLTLNAFQRLKPDYLDGFKGDILFSRIKVHFNLMIIRNSFKIENVNLKPVFFKDGTYVMDICI